MRARRGTHAIEFALLLPVLITLVSGVVDVGGYLVHTIILVQATAEGARAGSAADEDHASAARATATAAWTTNGGTGTVSFTATTTGVAPVERVVVSASHPFEPWFGIIPLPAQIEYRATFHITNQGG